MGTFIYETKELHICARSNEDKVIEDTESDSADLGSQDNTPHLDPMIIPNGDITETEKGEGEKTQR